MFQTQMEAVAGPNATNTNRLHQPLMTARRKWVHIPPTLLLHRPPSQDLTDKTPNHDITRTGSVFAESVEHLQGLWFGVHSFIEALNA